MSINIAIDGTAGSGKGTLADMLSKELGFYHIDTGAMFRAIAYKALEDGISLDNEKEIDQLIKYIDLKIVLKNGIQKNILDGKDLGDKIRKEEISSAASVISKFPAVREFTKELQREIASKYDIIIEGRDIGTVILPNADYKFYITANVKVRARRRLEQNKLPESEYERVLADMIERDKRDTERKICPLKPAEDAVYIDNSNDTPEQTLARILACIKK